MANSPLDFPSSESFRNKLIVKNLKPYPKSPRRVEPPTTYPTIQSDYAVVDSPDNLIDEPTFANNLYPLNQYGQEGGYITLADPNRLQNTKSNEGEYNYQDGDILDKSKDTVLSQRPLNPYGDGTNVIDSAIEFSNLNTIITSFGGQFNAQPYPSTFVASFYNPVNILLSTNPRGDSGNLSQDSFIAKLGAQILKKEFEERIAREIKQKTIGRANFLNIDDGTTGLGLLTGRLPLVEPNWQITVPSNPITNVSDLALRLAGTLIPISLIPGSYFDENINPARPTTTNQIQRAYSNSRGILSSLLGANKTGSQLFLNNTGRGQKSRLFGNLDYNKFKPDYDRNFFERLAGALFPSRNNNSEYYIGSRNSEPSRIFSPTGEMPIDEFNREVQTPVYGPSELAKVYEGETSKQIRLGSNGPIYSDGGTPQAGLTWVSPKSRLNVGVNVGVGGETFGEAPNFRSSNFSTSNESTSLVFKQGSILDETQRLINSTPQGAKRFQHVGNAIDQVSKVFNDGYVEMTKGSRVLRYVGKIPENSGEGVEYCRVFTKDVPYLYYGNLQKTDGMTTEGRKFSYSVLDKTYNLNMYPNKREGGQDSTNLIKKGETEYAKKYMFSIENLAWRTSSKPGYTISDLPMCERGPNGGRVMWFPPYDLKFTESSQANFKSTDFLGRPEPVYTYNNTSRSGSLSWKIVVDHPSVLNLIVNKYLAGQDQKKADSILESFFSNCIKYDLYELAKKYHTFNRSDLYEIQKIIQEKKQPKEVIKYYKQSFTIGSDGSPAEYKEETNPVSLDLSKYELTSAYFENDFPKKNNVDNFKNLYNSYLSNKQIYQKKGGEPASNFFDTTITKEFDRLEEFTQELISTFKKYPDKGNIKLTINASCSAPATKQYNKLLSERRIQSLKKYFTENQDLNDLGVFGSRLIITEGTAFGEETTATANQTVGGQTTPTEPFQCSDENGDNSKPQDKVYSIGAMACRRAYISNVVSSDFSETTKKLIKDEVPNTKTTNEFVIEEVNTEQVTVNEIVDREVQRDNISKRILRNLLTECDYFETIKENSPMVYNSLKDKLKFFNPAFHSTTPEGLNSRLTFLQQCLRPGETIPAVQKDGTLKYNDAINTSFGAPPVLVLRVGDFFHSKIIPDNLQLSYEGPLDMNTEGIGLQPMIASVTLGFKFVGGQGLASAVDKLQNALTFNYYANTEIYDERADVTDDSYKVIDKDFIDYFNNPPDAPKYDGQVQQPSKINQTIGTVTSATTTASSGETGSINYESFMKEFINSTQEYFINVVNKSEEVLKQYNNAVRQNWASQRNYTEGKFQLTTNDIPLFGKPSKIEEVFEKITNDFVDDIDNDDEGFMKFLKGTQQFPKNFSNKVIRTIRTNYKNYIKTKKSNYQSALTTITQQLTQVQQNLINTIAKNNLITFGNSYLDGSDGYVQSNGFVNIYVTKPTNKVYDKTYNDTLDELYGDTIKIGNNLLDYYNKLITPISYSENKFGQIAFEYSIQKSGEIFFPFSDNIKFSDIEFQRCYFLLSQEITDEKKYNSFKQAIIGNILSNPSLFKSTNTEIEKEFDGYWKNEVKPIFTEENSLTTLFLETFKTQNQNFIKYTPFNGSGQKKYEFDFQSIQSGDSTKKDREFLIENINNNNNKFKNVKNWADLNSNPALMVCKVKLG